MEKIINITLMLGESFPNDCCYTEKEKEINITVAGEPTVDIEKVIHAKLDVDLSNYNLTICGDAEDIVEFLNSHTIKSDKIIVREDAFDQTEIVADKFVTTIMKNVKDTDKLYIDGAGNTKLVKIDEYFSTMMIIEDLAKQIEEKNLSPLEQLMYLYDKVRDRYYIEEKDGEDPTLSRDISSVTKNEEIVCLGFAEIFDKVAKKLGLKSKVVVMLPKKEDEDGHAKNMVYINDEKYDYEGILSFDATIGCKKDDTNNHFDSYDAYAFENSLSYSGLVDVDGKKLANIYNKLIDDPDRKLSDDDECVAAIIIGQISEYDPDYLRDEIVCMGKHKEIKEIIFETSILYRDSFIPIDTFLSVLTTVRKIENDEDHEKFPFSKEKIFEITRNRFPYDLLINERLEEMLKDHNLNEIFEKNKINTKE